MKPIEKKLENGVRIITVPMKDNPTVTVLVMTKTGVRHESKETNGLSHFLEHMAFKGTKKRTNLQIAYELESLGALSNAYTSYDYTAYYAKGRAELFPKLLDIVADAYLDSIFPEQEIEKERGVICGEIDMVEDNPQHRVQYLSLEALYGDQPAGWMILGPKENIKKFTREDFVQYRDTHYIAEKTIVVVVGNVIVGDVEQQVAEVFQNMRTGKEIPKERIRQTVKVPVLVHNKKTDQSHLVINIEHVPMGDPDAPLVSVLTGILGQGMSSRLFMKLREEMGAGYYVSAEELPSDDTGALEIATGTEPGRVPEVIKAIIQEIKKIQQGKVPQGELEKTKELLIGQIYMGLESTHKIASHVAERAALHQPLKMPKDLEQEIRAVTVEDIHRVAHEYLKPEKFHLAIIGPHEDTTAIQAAFHFE